MRRTSDSKLLTHLTNLILTAALALTCGAAAQAGQAVRAEAGAPQPATSAASLLATIKAVDSDPMPKEARARGQAVKGLKRMGGAAVPALTEFLNREKGTPRVYAAEALAGDDRKVSAAAAELLKQMKRG